MFHNMNKKDLFQSNTKPLPCISFGVLFAVVDIAIIQINI